MNIILILRLLVMIGIAVGVCMSFVYIRDKSLVKKSLFTMRERINASGEVRKIIERHVYQMYGRRERKGLLNHIDDNLRYSGIQLKHSWLTTELYLVMSTVILTAVFLLVSVIGGSMAYGMVCVSALVLAAELYFNSQRRGRYNRIEEELLPFLNSIDAYAGATDDLISIFEKSVPVLNGPLKAAVYSAVLQSKQTGNCSEVLRNLENNIEHPFFKKLVRNLEMSSRHSANYKDIITECRFQLDEATSNAKKLEKIYKDGKLDIILVIICGMACVVLALMGILDYAVKDFFIQMWGTVPGKIIIMLCAASLLISFYIAFVSSQKRGA